MSMGRNAETKKGNHQSYGASMFVSFPKLRKNRIGGDILFKAAGDDGNIPSATPNLGDQLKSMGIANREQVDSISYFKLGPDGEKLEPGEVIIQISVPKAFQREISIEVFGTSGPECMKAVEPIAELLDLELISFTPKKDFYENNSDDSETVIINKDLKLNEGIMPSDQINEENKDTLGETW